MSGGLDEERFLDNVEYLFPVRIVDSDFIGKPREKSKTSYHEIKTRITRTLRVNWHLENMDILKVLFERTREYVEEKVRNRTLLREEELVLSVNREEDDCPFNISLIPAPEDELTYEIEIHTDETLQNQNQEGRQDNESEIKKLHETISARIPECDPVIIKFIEEALRCVYQANALLAAMFMLGAASEKAIYLLIHKYADSIQSEKHKERFLERISKRMISAKYDEFIRSYQNCRNQPTDSVLSQDLEQIINLTFQFSRIIRNESGHPQIVPEPDKGVVLAHIGHFVTYIERIYALMKYFDENGVIL